MPRPDFLPYCPAATSVYRSGEGRYFSPRVWWRCSRFLRRASNPTRSASSRGPIGWPRPSLRALSMSGVLATPSTSMFIASLPTKQLIRLVTNPGNSSTSTVSLPIRSATSRAASTVSSRVSRPRTSSTSFILCAGLKKCMAMQRSGRLVAAAISVGLIVEVLVASTARSGHSSSSRPKISSFSSISSGTASITRSASFTASSRLSVGEMRSRPPRISPTESLSLSTAFCISFWIPSSAPSSTLESTSCRVTRKPPNAAACTMPRPMVPAPMTATLSTSMYQSPRLTEGRHTGQGVAQNQGVHLVGALVGQDALQVVGVAYNRVVERNAVPAQDGARLPRYLYGLPNVVQLADGYLLGAQDALVLHPSDVQREQRALVYLHHHVHELFLRELETCNRLAELLAPLRVLQGALKTVPRGPHCAPDDPVPRLVEAGEGALEPFGLGEPRPFGEPDLLEEEFALDRGAHRELARYVSGGEPLSRRGHEEAANAVVGLGPHDCHVGYGSHTDPTLPAVQDPLGALLAGEGLHAGWIAPRLGLGEAEAAYRLTFGHSGEPLVLLLPGAELVDGAHRERALHADEGPETRVAGLELHAGEAVLDGALAGAAVPGEVHAKQALLAHLRHDLPGKDRLLPPLRDVRLYPLPDERADLLARRALLIREQDVEVHKSRGSGDPALEEPARVVVVISPPSLVSE